MQNWNFFSENLTLGIMHTSLCFSTSNAVHNCRTVLYNVLQPIECPVAKLKALLLGEKLQYIVFDAAFLCGLLYTLYCSGHGLIEHHYHHFGDQCNMDPKYSPSNAHILIDLNLTQTNPQMRCLDYMTLLPNV